MFKANVLHKFTRQLVGMSCLLLTLAISSSIGFTTNAISRDGNGSATADPLLPSPHQIYLPLLLRGTLAADASPSTQLSTPLLIEQAFDRGEITAAEQALYLAYALYEPQLLPLRFHSNVGWYGTEYVVQVQNFMQSVSAASTDAVQQELGRLATLAANVCDTEDGANIFNSTNFHFNYGTIGGGLAIADYVTSMEATFAIEVTQFGWAKPPLNANNPFGRYPIQIFNLGAGLYGYVSGGGGGLYTGFIGDNPNTLATETDALSSCMVLNNNFDQFPEPTAQASLDATTSHEFVHAIQNGYGDPGTREDSMWYESSASYMEDEIFDNANSNYSYLWPVVTNSLGEWPNNDEPGGISQYSNFLFFRHVAEHNGGTNTAGGGEDVMQHFWENVAAGQDALVAYNNALVTEGTNLANAFHKYAIAAKFSKACTGGYAGDYCFAEGADYVSFAGSLPPVQGTIAANPGAYNGSVRNHYAANWVSLPTSGSPYQVTLSNTAAGGQLRGSLVCDTGLAFTITPFSAVVGVGSSTSIASFSAANCASVVAVITNQQQTSGNPSSATAHSYTLAISAAVAAPTATVTDTPTNTPVVPTATATDTPTNTPVAPTATATDTPTNTPIVPTATATDTPTNTPVVPTSTATNTPTNTPIAPIATVTLTATPTVPSASVLLSSDVNGSVPGLSYRDEDIIAYNSSTGLWSLVFDGSDVGLGNADIDGFALLPNGQLLLSVEQDFTLNGLGAVDDADILKFIPSSYGPTTAGSYVPYFDGSDVGLNSSDEDVDAIDFDAAGNLLISVNGAFNAQSVSGADEDLFVLTGFTPGANTMGTWGFYFDGSDVSLTSSGEDIFGLWADHTHSKLYLATTDSFSVPGASGDEEDIFVCQYTTLGDNTACTFSLYWHGEDFGFDDAAIDGLAIGNFPTVVNTGESGGRVAVDDTVEAAGDDINEPNPLDGEEVEEEETLINRLFLPLVQQ